MNPEEPTKNKSMRAILSLSWQSIAYGVGVLGSQLIVYILLPFLTRYMPQEEYGVVSVMMAVYAFLNMLTNAGLPSAAYRFYNETEEDKDRRLTLGGSQLLFFIFAVLPAIFILLFPKPVSMFLMNTERYATALQLLAGYLVVDSMNTYGNIILRIEKRALTSSFHSVFLLACKIGLALLFVIGYEMGVAGYWLGYMLGEALGFFILTWLVWERITFDMSWERLVALMKFGVPLIPASLAMTALRVSDRYIIATLAGLEQAAIYDVGYKVGSIIMLIIAPFRIAWNPFVFSIARKPEAPQIFRDVLTYLTAGCVFLIFGVLAFRAELVQFLAPASYQEAEMVVGWVAISQLFYAAYFVLSKGSLIGNKPHQLVWGAVVSGLVNIVLNLILIPSMGILGAALSTLAGYIVLSIVSFYYSQQSFAIKVDWLRLGKLAITSAIILLGLNIMDHVNIDMSLRVILKVVVLSAFPVLLLLLRFINLAQGKELIELGRSMMQKKKNSDGNAIDIS
jgi:O-antigen/teichoic acid export membrane protein